MWCVLVLLALGPGYVMAGAGKLTEIAQICCNKGTSYAISHTIRDCSSSIPPDVPKIYGDFCKFSMDECCKEYFDKNRDCDEGINEASKTNSCDTVRSDTGKICCHQCLNGTMAGKSRGICIGGSRGSGADEFLPTEAFEMCCKNATKYQFNGPEDHRGPKHDDWKKSARLSADGPSLCEEYAPNELCAHHCIPVPGSYKCECNPGYKLMSDKKNCMEIVKNRCKPRNPCKHKCSDNGVEVKCSCRRGYQLMADGKSCEDIDECKRDPLICVTGTQCHNIQGSYKCIPAKKNLYESGQCPPGFTRNPHNNACDDINECALLHPPCPTYICDNTVGGYKCGGVSGDPANLATKHPPPAEDRCPPGFKAVRTDVGEKCEDVDECESNNDDCNHQSQFCINTRGSFHCQDKASKHCPPGFKIDAVSKKCEDIDECLDSHSLCPHDKVCVNFPGVYDCEPKIDFSRSTNCPEGMRKKPGNTHCEDIDECLEGTHLCDQYQSCLNTNGSHECRCKLGFELDTLTGACIDINECATDQNDCIPESQRCDNTVGSYLCVRFISCGTGYTLQHASGKCEDIDECALGKDNCGRAGPNFMCKNIPGSFRCVRRPSSTTTTPNPDYEYYDTDEEIDSETDLEQNGPPESKQVAQSTTTTQTAPTTQPAPTQSSTASTIPTDVISVIIPTEPETKGSETPLIDLRFPDTVKYNEPKQEAAQPDFRNEPESEDPNDNIVQPVYSVPKEPEPSKQPEMNNNDEQPPPPPLIPIYNENQDSAKTTPHIVLLKVPNETATVRALKSDDGSLVINTNDVPKNEWTKIADRPEPSSCQVGFEMDDYGACVDIDECTTNRHVCSGLTEICRNNMGGYICDCAIGFRRDLRTGACDLIATSSTSTTTSTAAPPPTSTETRYRFDYPVYHPPKSRPFRPRTLCDIGFNMNSATGKCEDIDECTNGLATCAAVEVCVNTKGGYRCDCLPNWKYDEIRHKCIPNRDKNKFPLGYANVPGRTEVRIGGKHDHGNKFEEPTYTKVESGRGGILKCHWGYKLGDDNTCEDIDECAIGSAKCAADQICTNLLGGYTCSCPSGHRLMDDQTCEDVDECDLAGDVPICSQNADCINTIGSYHCKCHQGFTSAPANDKVCVDVNECIESRSKSLCQQRCKNNWGNYSCLCHRGYRLNADNKTCSDIDECTEFKSKLPCIGKCLNEPGSYRCACPKGYRLSQDKRSCIDIDECETGEAFCASTVSGRSGSNFCFNIRGGYKCEKISCPQGYRLESRHRCTKIDTLCQVGDWDCIHQPSTYSYHYITFVSKLDIPDNKVDLYTMSVPAWPNARTKFQLQLVKADSPPTVKLRADINSFLLTSTNKNAVVSIVQSLEGPQSIELELSMELYSDESFAGIAVAKLFIYVTEYTF